MPPGRRLCMSEEDKRAKKAAFQRLKVYLKTQFGRWREFRAAKGLVSDDQVAKFLLDWYEATCDVKVTPQNDDQPLDLSLKTSHNSGCQQQHKSLYLPLREQVEQKPRLPTPDDCKWYPQQPYSHAGQVPSDTVLRTILQQPAVKRTCHTPPSLQESLSLHASRDHRGELPDAIYQRNAHYEEKRKLENGSSGDVPENLSINETEDDSESSSSSISSSSGGEITSCNSQLSTDSSLEDDKPIPVTGRKPMQLFPFKPKIDSSINVPTSGLVARDTRLQRHLRLQNLNQDIPKRHAISVIREMGGVDNDVDKDELIDALGLYRKYVSQPKFVPTKVIKRPNLSQDESIRRSFRQKRKKVYHEYCYEYEDQISNLCNVEDPETWISEFTELDLEDERGNCIKEERISPTQEKENRDLQIFKKEVDSNIEEVKPKNFNRILQSDKCKKKKKKSLIPDLPQNLNFIKQEPVDPVDDAVPDTKESKKKLKSPMPKKKTMRNTSKKPCPVCGKLVCSFGFKPHMRSHQSAAEHKCKECGFVTPILTNLIRHHTQLHEQDMGEVLCKQCGKRFWNKLRYAHHYKLTHMTPSEFPCPKCDKSFKDRHRLRHHDMAVHLQIRTRACTWDGCGKVFKTTHHLIQHYRLHTGEKPYKCRLCDYAAAQQNSVNYHMKSKHGLPIPQKPFKQTYDDLDIGIIEHVAHEHSRRRKSDPGWRDVVPQEMMDNFNFDVMGKLSSTSLSPCDDGLDEDAATMAGSKFTEEFASTTEQDEAIRISGNKSGIISSDLAKDTDLEPVSRMGYNSNSYNNISVSHPEGKIRNENLSALSSGPPDAEVEAAPSSVMGAVDLSSVMEARKPQFGEEEDSEEEPGEVRIGENFCQELYEILKLGNVPSLSDNAMF